MDTTDQPFHAVMFPWFAMGHLSPFLHLSNKLAEKGHRVSFLLPKQTQNKLNHLNLHPHLIQFIPLTLPQVDGLPLGAETTSDVPHTKSPLLELAFDQTQNQVHATLQHLKPDLIFFDYAYWLPSLAHPLGSKCIFFYTSSAASCARCLAPYTSSLEPLALETRDGFVCSRDFDGGIPLIHRINTAIKGSEAVCFRGCSEMEGPLVDYIEKQWNKKVLIIGPLLPPPASETPLEERWEKWLGGFKKGSVVYCALGSESVLSKEQFQELVLGIELTGLPFLLRLKPPFGFQTVEEALPEGFEDRVKGRGVVHGGWVQQQHILAHPSVGCFVSHCGSGSMWEALISTCQIVLVPTLSDQFENTKFMTEELKVAVDVEGREPDQFWFTRENVCKAVKLVMDEGSEVGEEVRANHNKWREFLLNEGLQSPYTNNFITKLQDLLR